MTAASTGARELYREGRRAGDDPVASATWALIGVVAEWYEHRSRWTQRVLHGSILVVGALLLLAFLADLMYAVGGGYARHP